MDENLIHISVENSDFSEKFYFCSCSKIAQGLGLFNSKAKQNEFSAVEKKLLKEVQPENFPVGKDELFDLAINSLLVKQLQSKNFRLAPFDIADIKSEFLKHLESKNFQLGFFDKTDISKIKNELVNYLKDLESKNLDNLSRKLYVNEQNFDPWNFLKGILLRGLVYSYIGLEFFGIAKSFIKEHILHPHPNNNVAVVAYSPGRAIIEGTKICTKAVLEGLNKFPAEHGKFMSYHDRRFLINETVLEFLAQNYLTIENHVVDAISDNVDKIVQEVEIRAQLRVLETMPDASYATLGNATNAIPKVVASFPNKKQHQYHTTNPNNVFYAQRTNTARAAKNTLTSSPPLRSFTPSLTFDRANRVVTTYAPCEDITDLVKNPCVYEIAITAPNGVAGRLVGKAGGGGAHRNGPGRAIEHLQKLKRGTHANNLAQLFYDQNRPYLEQTPDAIKIYSLESFPRGTPKEEVLKSESEFIEDRFANGARSNKNFHLNPGETQSLCLNKHHSGEHNLTPDKIDTALSLSQADLTQMTHEQFCDIVYR